jgi:SAM-dependent methyltransferase
MASRTGLLISSLKKRPSLYRLARRIRLAAGHLLPPTVLPGVPGRVHRNDLMLEDRSSRSAEVYGATGREAVELIGQALRASGRTFSDVTAALDFGCGHGRVLRWLVERIDPSRVTACDLDPEAVRFCASEFAVMPLVSDRSFQSVAQGSYDLVWAGSVATHLPEDAWRTWVTLMPQLLQPGGVVVFTTHEPALVLSGVYTPDLQREGKRLKECLDKTGFAYLPYRHYGAEGYGIAFHDRRRVDQDMSEVGLRRTLFLRRGWVTHQDVHAFMLGGDRDVPTGT